MGLANYYGKNGGFGNQLRKIAASFLGKMVNIRNNFNESFGNLSWKRIASPFIISIHVDTHWSAPKTIDFDQYLVFGSVP